MKEEAKKAIDLLKFYEGFFKNIGHEEEVKSIESVINYIENLQKENEELKEEKVTYLNKVYNKIDNFKYKYKKAEMHSDPESASFYRDVIRHFKKLLEEE